VVNPRNRADDSSEAGYIPMTYIDGGYVNCFHFDIRKWGEVKTGLTHLADGDVAFAKITPCFQNRKSMVLSGLPNGIAGGTTELNVLRTYGDTICREYLLYFVKTHYFIVEASFKGTAGQQRVRTGYTENKLIPIPPISEQYRIVQKIIDVMPLTEKYEISKSNLDFLNLTINNQLRKSILQEAIQGRLVPQNLEDEPASELLRRIHDEKLRLVKEGKLNKSALTDSVIFRGDDNKYFEKRGKEVVCIDEEVPFEIPAQWEWTRLSYIADIYTGNSISETEKNAKFTGVRGRYYIGTKDVGFDSDVIYNNGVAIPPEYENNFRIASNKSILMCIEGGSAGRKIAILNQDVCFGNKLCCFSPFIAIEKYIFYYLQSPAFLDMFNGNKKGIIGGVSIAKLKTIRIPLPPQQEIERIVRKIDEFVASIMRD